MRIAALLLLAAACTSTPTAPDKSFVAKMCGNPPDAPVLAFGDETQPDGTAVQCAGSGQLTADSQWRMDIATWEDCVLSLTAKDIGSGAL